MTENVEFADRFMNKKWFIKKNTIKEKKELFQKLEFFIPEYEYRRLKKDEGSNRDIGTPSGTYDCLSE